MLEVAMDEGLAQFSNQLVGSVIVRGFMRMHIMHLCSPASRTGP
jgi:hypothetical protein